MGSKHFLMKIVRVLRWLVAIFLTDTDPLLVPDHRHEVVGEIVEHDAGRQNEVHASPAAPAHAPRQLAVVAETDHRLLRRLERLGKGEDGQSGAIDRLKGLPVQRPLEIVPQPRRHRDLGHPFRVPVGQTVGTVHAEPARGWFDFHVQFHGLEPRIDPVAISGKVPAPVVTGEIRDPPTLKPTLNVALDHDGNDGRRHQEGEERHHRPSEILRAQAPEHESRIILTAFEKTHSSQSEQDR